MTESKFKAGDKVRWLGITATIVESSEPGKYRISHDTDEGEYEAYESELTLVEE